MHVEEPAALYVSAAHGVGADDVDAHEEPAGQAVHDAALVPPVAVRYVPAAHAVGVEAPAAVHEPAGVAAHEEALVPPAVVLYVPVTHCVQEVALAALQVPAAHGVGADDVDAQYEPAGQAVHDAAFWPPVVVRYVPAAHCVQVVALAALQKPAAHCVHAVMEPVAGEYVPAGHASQ